MNEVARGVGVKEWIRSGPSEVDARASKDWKRDEVEARGPPTRDWRRGLSSGGKDWRRASGGDTGKDWKRDDEVDTRASKDW